MSQSLPTIQLKPSQRPRILQGHPWVFASEIKKPLADSADGQAVQLLDHRGRPLGTGIYNNKSQIIWRRFSREAVDFDQNFLQKALSKSIDRREGNLFCRLVWSEADRMPGLVVDRFDDVLVVQALTLAVDQRLPIITEILQDLLKPREIVYRNDAPTRRHEGLSDSVSTASGNPLSASAFTIDGLTYELDLEKGHKTGFYLDQRAQHRRVAEFAAGKTVLDGFSNQGAFALHCARAGATSVLAIEISETCAAAINRNAAENDLPVDIDCANMFDWFTDSRERKFDLIILDPPSFARNKKAVPTALKGYKELNLRAMRMLNPGGILATYSCSQNISALDFNQTLIQAASDAHRDMRLIEETGQPADHPVLINMPETHYLKGAILQYEA